VLNLYALHLLSAHRKDVSNDIITLLTSILYYAFVSWRILELHRCDQVKSAVSVIAAFIVIVGEVLVPV